MEKLIGEFNDHADAKRSEDAGVLYKQMEVKLNDGYMDANIGVQTTTEEQQRSRSSYEFISETSSM